MNNRVYSREEYDIINGYKVNKCKQIYIVLIENCYSKTFHNRQEACNFAKQTGKRFEIVHSHQQGDI